MKWLIVALAFFATTATAELNIKYLEHALFMTVTKGERSGKIVCLNTKQPKGGLPTGWKKLTCNSLESPVQWIACFANVEKKSFLCGKFKVALKN